MVTKQGNEMNSLNEQMDAIMDRFDFSRVQTAMKALKWTWWQQHPQVPDLREIKDNAEYLMRQAVIGYVEGAPFYSVSSGGFTALILRYNSGPTLELSFNVERRWGCTAN